MATLSQSFSRDANRIPLTKLGLMATSTQTLSANGTVAVPIFTITGTVDIISLYGIVTTVIGSNHTAAHWRINDQTSTAVVITAAAGTTVSSLPAGSFLSRGSLVSVALVATSAAAGALKDPVAATAPDILMPFSLTQKTGGIKTDIEYVYTTNNSSGGVIKFYCGFVPLSDDGNVTAY